MTGRTSARAAAQKAKEAITSFAEGSSSASGSKRKASTDKAPAPNKQRETEPQQPKQENAAGSSMGGPPEVRPNREQRVGSIPGTTAPVDQSFPPAHQLGSVFKPDPEATDLPDVKPLPPNPMVDSVPGTRIPVDESMKYSQGMEYGVHKSEGREQVISSSILEKGIIYFFFRPRVNIEDPHGMGDVARSFFVLRPTPLGADFDAGQGSMEKDAKCRLLMLPKKKFPTSAKERDMAFVEKAGQSIKDLQEKFIASSTYQTKTVGESTIEEARPYAEGVYAITTTKRASHLAYELTIPAELGEIQENFGLHHRGSWLVQSKNPKFPGPPTGQLPRDPDFPESVREKFGDLRWVPMQPEFIEYPNSQILMIGEAVDSLGKAATAEDNQKPGEAEPGQELARLAEENEHRVDALQGNETIFHDLGLHAQKYRYLPTTWNSS